MEWKIYLRYQEKAYRILKLKQGANLDITIIPRNAIYFSREVIKNLDINEQIQLKYEFLRGAIDHYSAHALTGQRHIKFNKFSSPIEPTFGYSFKDITKPIPLLTIIATANLKSYEEPSSGKWFGFQLPDDANYLIMDLFAVPKNSQAEFQQNFTLLNEIKTRETFDYKEIEMRNCFIAAFIRTTNHNLTDIPNNIVFQQVEGKSVNVIRVEKGVVLAEVSHLYLNNI